jgi:hypothetical protein
MPHSVGETLVERTFKEPTLRRLISMRQILVGQISVMQILKKLNSLGLISRELFSGELTLAGPYSTDLFSADQNTQKFMTPSLVKPITGQVLEGLTLVELT